MGNELEKNVKFYARLLAFLIFSLVAPIIYIYTKFKLYQSKITISLWGFICVVIAFAVFSTLIKYYIKGLKTKYSFVKQVLTGVVKVVIPLILFYMLVVWFNDKVDVIVKNLDLVKDTLLVIIPCEAVAVVVNPLPKWCFDNNIEGIGQILDKIIPAKESGK